MSKLKNLSKKDLAELATKKTANKIAKLYGTTVEDVYISYRLENLLGMLELPLSFIRRKYKENNEDDIETCFQLCIGKQVLHRALKDSVIGGRPSLYNCRFELAKKACQGLGYKDAMHYIEVNGREAFKREVIKKL